jgi:hypothetical protein
MIGIDIQRYRARRFDCGKGERGGGNDEQVGERDSQVRGNRISTIGTIIFHLVSGVGLC